MVQQSYVHMYILGTQGTRRSEQGTQPMGNANRQGDARQQRGQHHADSRFAESTHNESAAQPHEDTQDVGGKVLSGGVHWRQVEALQPDWADVEVWGDCEGAAGHCSLHCAAQGCGQAAHEAGEYTGDGG